MSRGLLYANSYPINDKISINIPTLGQILEDEDAYYGVIADIIATPYDYMVQLDDAGIDFEQITQFDLFVMLFERLAKNDTRLIFGDLDLSKFQIAINEQNGNIVLRDEENNITIDRAIHSQICAALRKINHLEHKDKKPGNAEAKKYMIERARIKQRRAARRERESQLEQLIVALVNTEQFKYGYENVLNLTIYQFNESVDQIVKKINYDNLMIGCYSGTVNAKEISQDQFNWLTTK